MVIKAYEEEQQWLEAEIQAKKVRVLELQAKIQTLKTTVPPTVNDLIATSSAIPTETAPAADAMRLLSALCNFLSSLDMFLGQIGEYILRWYFLYMDNLVFFASCVPNWF
ncbi:hypothetical protein LIER_15254 [Lithospermum erythrorhizon]|uniref:Uncharacterized protein n=1 Tax=Lithospermum erythrorhizon TaxID=34254 RepID=A0AAV3Q2J9_LITER